MQNQPPRQQKESQKESFFGSPSFQPLPDPLPQTLRRLPRDPSQSMIIASDVDFDIGDSGVFPDAETLAIPEVAQPSAQIRALRGNQIAIASLIITGSFVVSRILGVLRLSLMAFTFSGKDADSFTLAFTLPNAVFNLISGGALVSAFLPVFTDYMVRRQDRRTAWHITSAAFNLSAIMLAALAGLAFIFINPLTHLYANDVFVQHPDEAQEIMYLSRLMLLQPMLLGISVISTSVLQARQRFLLPAVGQVLYTSGQVLGIGATLIDEKYHIFGGHLGLLGPTYGVLAGAAAQFLIQIPGLIGGKMKYTLTFDFMHPGVRQMVKLMLPRLANSLMIYVVVNFVTQSLLTSIHGNGIVFGYSNAFTVIQLPVGVFGMALSQAVFPSLTTFVTLKDWDRVRSTIFSGLRIILFLSIPTALAIIVTAVRSRASCSCMGN